MSKDERIRILGKVRADMDGNWFESAVGFYNYIEEESWRKAYCYWQKPLVWLTLTAWALYVPAYYPCMVGEGNSTPSVAAREARIIATLQKATKAMGGNLVVVSALGKTVYLRRGTHELVGETEATYGEGYAISVHDEK